MKTLMTAYGELNLLNSEQEAKDKDYEIFAIEEHENGTRILIYNKIGDYKNLIAVEWVKQSTELCQFYEPDLELMKMCDVEAAEQMEQMGRDEYLKMLQSMDEMEDAHNGPVPEELKWCYKCCANFRQCSGHPGETLCCCNHPENQKILWVDQETFRWT